MTSNILYINLLPIDWQALSAMATFIVATIALFELRQIRRKEKEIEKLEIREKIIRPLKEDFKSLINWLGSTYTSNWRWRWLEIKDSNNHIIFHISPTTRERIEKFNINFEKFRNLTNQLQQNLKETIANIIRPRLMLLASGEDSANAYFQCRIGGKYHSIALYELVLWGESLAEHIEKLKKDPALPNKRISDEQFVVPGFSQRFSEKEFDEVLSEINKEIRTKPEFENYVNSFRTLYREAIDLEKEIKL